MILIDLKKNTVFLINEGEETDENEISEQSNQVGTQSDENSTECTLVYTADYEIVCAEDLINYNNQINEQVTKVEIEETEEQQMYNHTVLDTIQQIKASNDRMLESSDTVALLEIYEDIQTTLDNIFDYLSLFIGLFFIGWIFSQLNSWRRNNKSD